MGGDVQRCGRPSLMTDHLILGVLVCNGLWPMNAMLWCRGQTHEAGAAGKHAGQLVAVEIRNAQEMP